MIFLRILLVEDDPMDQLVIQKIAESAGFEMDVVDNGVQAISKLNSGHYDLVIMDLEMPLMNGYETTTYIRQSLAGKENIPIIIITSKEGLGEAAHCLLLGANTFLAKPVSRETLIREINTLVVV